MDPLIFASSTIEVPFGISEYEWAGAIRGEPYKVVKAPVTGLPVPASSEIVLEGYIYADKMAPEGPFGEWTGYYGDRREAEPVLTVEGVYFRNDPIMLGVPPNKPPAYDPYLYREYLRSALLLRELRGTGIPGIADVHCFAVGGTRLFNVVSIEQKYAGHSRQTLHAFASLNAASYMGRLVVVVDDDIDVTDPRGCDLGDADARRSAAIGRHRHADALGPARPGSSSGRQALQLSSAHRRDETVGMEGPVSRGARAGREDEDRDAQEVGPPAARQRSPGSREHLRLVVLATTAAA